MNCPECNQPMLLGESGWVCPSGHGRIIPDRDTPSVMDLDFGQRRSKKTPHVKHSKTVQQRGDQIEQGLRGLSE